MVYRADAVLLQNPASQSGAGVPLLRLSGLAVATPAVGEPLSGQVTATNKSVAYQATFTLGGVVADSQGNVLWSIGTQNVQIGQGGLPPNGYEPLYWTASGAVTADQQGQALTVYYGDNNAIAQAVFDGGGLLFSAPTGALSATVTVPGAAVSTGGGSTGGTPASTGGQQPQGSGGQGPTTQPQQPQGPGPVVPLNPAIPNTTTLPFLSGLEAFWGGLSGFEKAAILGGGALAVYLAVR